MLSHIVAPPQRGRGLGSDLRRLIEVVVRLRDLAFVGERDPLEHVGLRRHVVRHRLLAPDEERLVGLLDHALPVLEAQARERRVVVDLSLFRPGFQDAGRDFGGGGVLTKADERPRKRLRRREGGVAAVHREGQFVEQPPALPLLRAARERGEGPPIVVQFR